MRLFILRIRSMIKKELIQAIRDPRMRFLIFMPPMIQLFAFGYAANLDLKHIPTALYDEDRSAVSRELAFAFSSSGYFRFVKLIEKDEEMAEILDRSEAKAIVHFGTDLESRINSGRSAEIQIITAGTDSNTASLVNSYAMQILEGYNRSRLAERIARNPALSRIIPAGASGVVKPQIRVWYNPDLSSRNFYVPGIIALIIMLVTLTLTSMSIVREKEIGTMEQIMVTPIRPVEFILGKTVPFSLIGIVQVTLVTSIGVFWFGVPMRGSIWCLFGSLLVYQLSCLSLGLLISTICRTQQQALVTTFFFFLPAILLSGFIFPIDNMPKIIQYVTWVNPLRYFLVIIRSIFLKGVGLEVLWQELSILFVIGLAMMTIAVKRVGKTLD